MTDEREKYLLRLERENDYLRERLRDFVDDYKVVVKGRCAPDEHHCACVPHLRAYIARLRDTSRAAADELEGHWAAHADEHGFGPVNLLRRLRELPDYYPGNAQSVGEEVEHTRVVAFMRACMGQADAAELRTLDLLLEQIGTAKAHRVVG